jgi:hypothetical protein
MSLYLYDAKASLYLYDELRPKMNKLTSFGKNETNDDVTITMRRLNKLEQSYSLSAVSFLRMISIRRSDPARAPSHHSARAPSRLSALVSRLAMLSRLVSSISSSEVDFYELRTILHIRVLSSRAPSRLAAKVGDELTMTLPSATFKIVTVGDRPLSWPRSSIGHLKMSRKIVLRFS